MPKPTQSELELLVVSALENLNEEHPDVFFTPSDINEQIEESKDWDSDNLKRGRLAKISNKRILQVLINLGDKQIEGMDEGCHIVESEGLFQFRPSR